MNIERPNRRRYQEIAQARSALQHLSARLVAAQETERRTISRELHDQVGQTLNALLVDAANLEKRMPAEDSISRRYLDNAAEEHCVLQVVAESRYKEYLRAYSTYQHWDTLTYERVLQNVKDVALVPAPSEMDEADRIAVVYFRKHADGNEHLLVYDGELHDETLYSTRDRVQHDPEKLKAVIKVGKPMIFFHNPSRRWQGRDVSKLQGLWSRRAFFIHGIQRKSKPRG